MFDPAHDWPVYVMVAIFFGAFIYLIVRSKIEEKKENQNKNKQKDNKG